MQVNKKLITADCSYIQSISAKTNNVRKIAFSKSNIVAYESFLDTFSESLDL